jgi:hypothetical protein
MAGGLGHPRGVHRGAIGTVQENLCTRLQGIVPVARTMLELEALQVAHAASSSWLIFFLKSLAKPIAVNRYYACQYEKRTGKR